MGKAIQCTLSYCEEVTCEYVDCAVVELQRLKFSRQNSGLAQVYNNANLSHTEWSRVRIYECFSLHSSESRKVSLHHGDEVPLYDIKVV